MPFQGCNCLLSLAEFVFGGVTVAVFAYVPDPLVVGISFGRSLSLATTLGFILLVCRLLVPRDFVFLGLARKLILVGSVCFRALTYFAGIVWARAFSSPFGISKLSDIFLMNSQARLQCLILILWIMSVAD